MGCITTKKVLPKSEVQNSGLKTLKASSDLEEQLTTQDRNFKLYRVGSKEYRIEIFSEESLMLSKKSKDKS